MAGETEAPVERTHDAGARPELPVELNEGRFLKPCRMYEVLTLPFVFPPCGHGVNRDIEPTRRTYRLKK